MSHRWGWGKNDHIPANVIEDEVAQQEAELRWQLEHGGISADNFNDISFSLANCDTPWLNAQLKPRKKGSR